MGVSSWAGKAGSTALARGAAVLASLAFSLSLQVQSVLAASCGSKPDSDLVIAIDVGHVARQPGEQCHRGMTCPWGETSARGVPEYDFNLKLAERINEELVRQGFRAMRLLVTPPGGSLKQRTDRANDMNADLFLSIHHDGVRDEALKPWVFEGKTQYYFDESSGFSLHVSPRNPRYDESLELARIIADRLMAKGLQFTRIHDQTHVEGARVPWADAGRGIYKRSDVFILGAARMPAVLLEGGVIVNRGDEQVLSTPAYQAGIAAVVADSIRQFCHYAAVAAYRVTGVAANDVLNIRAEPDAGSAIVGTIPPDGKDIRITGNCAGQWCPVAYQAASGWVNRRFIAGE